MNTCSLEDLADILGEVVDLTGLAVRAASVLGADVPIDSRDMLRFVTRIEARYRIRLAPAEVLAVKTLGDLLAAVNRRRGASR